MSDDGSGTMCLALDVDAARRLAAPKAAFADAESWTVALGVVGDDYREAAMFARDHDLPQDFFPGDRAKAEALTLLAQQYPADRHVLVGTGDADRDAAEAAGWEYLPLAEAAEKADWDLVGAADGGSDDGDDSLVDSVRRHLPF